MVPMQMTQPILDHLLSRRSIKAAKLAAPGPDADQLDKILRAGIRVPDHGKIKPWRIRIVREAGQAKMSALCRAIYARENPDCPPSTLETEAARFGSAPLLLAVAMQPDPNRSIPLSEQRLSAGAMCMNILHAAHALGFAGNWLTGWPARHADMLAALDFAEAEEIAGFIHIGTPTVAPEERPRPEPAEIATEWG